MEPGTQQTQTTSQPWGPQQGLFKRAIRDANRLYSNPGKPFSMLVPHAKQSTQAFGNLTDMANDNSGDQGLQGNLQGIINNGGFNNEQRGALNNWQSLANSSYDFNANPGAQGVLDSILRDTRNAVNLNTAAAGRSNSGLHQGRLAQDIADTSSNFRMNDYNSWLGRRDAANSNLFNAAQAGLGNMTAAYGGMAAPQQTLLGVGGAYEDLDRRVKDERARLQNLPWENIQKLLAVGSGAGSYGTSTATSPGPNPFLQGLGIAGTLGNFAFGTNPMASQGILGLLK